jgi:hypothetical protein
MGSLALALALAGGEVAWLLFGDFQIPLGTGLTAAAGAWGGALDSVWLDVVYITEYIYETPKENDPPRRQK